MRLDFVAPLTPLVVPVLRGGVRGSGETVVDADDTSGLGVCKSDGGRDRLLPYIRIRYHQKGLTGNEKRNREPWEL